MEFELKQQLRVDDPMEEPVLQLDGLKISSIQVLLEPPTSFNPVAEDEDEDDGFYSPLDHFQNLVKLSMNSSQCESLKGFPKLPLLRSLLLADNNLSSGFEALAKADLQSLVRLDLSGNKISDVDVLEPLVALENLQYLSVAENEIAGQENYRDAIFDVLPQLITVDGLDRDGTELDIDDDEALDSGDEEGHFEVDHDEREDEGEYQIDDGEVDQDDEDREDETEVTQLPPRHSAQQGDESEDLGSDDENDHEDEEEEEQDNESQGSDSELEDQENRPVMGGKTTGGSSQVDDEEDDDELDEEDEEVAQQQHQRGSDDEEEDEEEDDDDDEEEDEHDEEDEEEEEEEAPGLAYLLTDDIPDENDEEFEPGNEVEEESEMETSDDEEYGSRNAPSRPTASTSDGSNINGHPKRPRSPTPEFNHSAVGLDNNPTGFDIDDAEDAANGFGMAPFDGPATFDDDAAHDTKRQRS
ncbi:hypothetical protein BGZ68_009214 [Mortierella alpina]|nr:hypothetical protein BGZ68_009214 [Mortierella alpina]